MGIHVRRVASPNSHLGGHVLLPRITCVIIVIISILSTIIIILIITILRGCTQNPISTKSHICFFVRLYGIVFVIIVIIIIIMIIKSKGVNAQL